MKASKVILLFFLLSSSILVERAGCEISTKEGRPLLTRRGVLPLQAESENWIRPRNETKILFDFFHEPEYNDTQLAGFWDYLNATYIVKNNTYTITEMTLEDVDILVLVGPTLNFTSGPRGEIEVITEFLHANGSLLVAPPLHNKTNLDDLTIPFGFSFENNTVIDPTTNYNNSEILVRVTQFDSIPLTTNVLEVGFHGRNILINSTWMERWQPPISFQNISVDLHPFMWGAPTTTTRENRNITGSDVVLGVAMETSLDARLVGVGSDAMFSTTFVTTSNVTGTQPLENATDESSAPLIELQSPFGNTAVFLKNMIDWLAKRTGVITSRDFMVNVLGNSSRTTIDNGVPITATIMITDQNGSVIERLTSEDLPLFGLRVGERFKRNVTLSGNPNGTLFTGTIDTTGMSRGWVIPSVSVHTRGYSYLDVDYGDVFVLQPPSRLYQEPLGVFFLVSLMGDIGLFAVAAFWTWQTFSRTSTPAKQS